MSEQRISIPRPHVPFGPQQLTEDQADADYLREAARKLEEHYKPFGSNLRSTVVKLIRDAAVAIEGGNMTAVYDRAHCTTCGHTINDHDANECWKTVDGKQCDCGWMGVPNE